MLLAPVLRFVNHLLEGEAWARSRLRAFSGKTLRVVVAPFDLRFVVTPEGTLDRAADASAPAAVTLSLPDDAPWRVLRDGPAALAAAAHINGAADFAECLGFLLRNVRWDVEGDLANLVGDIAARRLAQAGRALLHWQRDSFSGIARNLAEYLVYERPLIAGRPDIDRFRRELGDLVGASDRIERRIDALASRPHRRSTA